MRDANDGESNGGHQELAEGPRYLLDTIHWWHPGSWLPPGETLTVASFLVGLSAALFIFLDPQWQALFRFPTWSLPSPWDQYYLLVPIATAWFAWYIFRHTVYRPGLMYPRWYSLLLAITCTGIAVFGLIDRFVLKTFRGSPVVHGAAAASVMAVLTLSFRLKRVFPFQRMVQELAPIALGAVLLAGLPLAAMVGHYMVEEEKSKVKSSYENLDDLAEAVRRATQYPWNTLKDKPSAAKKQVEQIRRISLTQALPDRWVWDGAALLGLTDTLVKSCGNLASAVTEGLTKVNPPRLDLPRLRADKSGELVQAQPAFEDAATITAAYHREIHRLLAQLETKLPSSPAGDVYDRHKMEYSNRVAKVSESFGEEWLVPLISMESQEDLPPIDVAQTRIGTAKVAEFSKLIALSWASARQIGRDVPGCAEEPFKYTSQIKVTEKPDRDDPKTWFERTRTYFYTRVECYAYVRGGSGADMLAQVHWTYRSELDNETLADNRPPFEVSIYWEPPHGKSASDYRDIVMDALARAVKNIYKVPAAPLRSGSFSGGFRGPGFAVVEAAGPGRKGSPSASNVIRLRVQH